MRIEEANVAFVADEESYLEFKELSEMEFEELSVQPEGVYLNTGPSEAVSGRRSVTFVPMRFITSIEGMAR